jgi:alpha-tubulin suppressor-like RCC1 family protein
MGGASSVPATRAEKWSYFDIYSAARQFFAKDAFVAQVKKADRLLAEEAAAMGDNSVRLNGEKLLALTQADYERLGFVRIGWPSWSSVVGQIHEIHAEQDREKRRVQEEAARAAGDEKRRAKEALMRDRGEVESELLRLQQMKDPGHAAAAAEAEAEAAAAAAAAAVAAAQLKDLPPGDVPPDDPAYDPRGWIDPATGSFVRRPRKPNVWWATGLQSIADASDCRAKAEVRQRAVDEHDPCLAATFMDGEQPLKWHASADPLYVAGANGSGQLGLGDAVPRPRLTRVACFAEALLLQTHPPPAQPVFAPRRVRLVACGNAHTVVATANYAAEVWTIGDNTLGQLGVGHTRSEPRPQRVERLRGMRVAHLACGLHHTLCAVTSSSATTAKAPRVFAWGDNGHGELGIGLGQMSTQNSPMPVLDLDGMELVAVACGAAHCAVVDAEDALFTWGHNEHGQLGHGGILPEPKPKRQAAMSGGRIAGIALGGAHCVVWTVVDQVWGWGDNAFDQLGLGHDQKGRDQLLPVMIMDRAVVTVACGEHHTLCATAAEQDGVAAIPEVLGFGLNDAHQLGRGAELPALKGATIVQIECGYRHVLALMGDGSTWAWGANGSGQLANGATATSVAEPKPLSEELVGPRGGPARRLASLSFAHHTAVFRPSEYEREPPPRSAARFTPEQQAEQAAEAELERAMEEEGLDKEEKKARRFIEKNKRDREVARWKRANESEAAAADPLFERLPLQKTRTYAFLEPKPLPGQH